MPYKTILVHVDETGQSAQRVALACQLALANEAHLLGVATTGVSRYVLQTAALNVQDPLIGPHLAWLREQAETALAGFEASARQAGVASFEKRVIDDEAGVGLATAARYADLVLLGQVNAAHDLPGPAKNVTEFVLVHGGCPLLVLPYAGQFEHVGQQVLLAWDGSAGARRALAGALPLLQKAANVDVVVYNPEAGEGEHGEQPGADISLYLARHGVKTTVVQEATAGDVGEALLSLAANRGADLLVMGGYGHARMREILMGGATRSVLASMTLPVLLAH